MLLWIRFILLRERCTYQVRINVHHTLHKSLKLFTALILPSDRKWINYLSIKWDGVWSLKFNRFQILQDIPCVLEKTNIFQFISPISMFCRLSFHPASLNLCFWTIWTIPLIFYFFGGSELMHASWSAWKQCNWCLAEGYWKEKMCFWFLKDCLGSIVPASDESILYLFQTWRLGPRTKYSS